MTLTIDLPHTLAKELTVEAQQQGLALSEYALSLLDKRRTLKEAESNGFEQARLDRVLATSGQVLMPRSATELTAPFAPVEITGELVSEIATEQRGPR